MYVKSSRRNARRTVSRVKVSKHGRKAPLAERLEKDQAKDKRGDDDVTAFA